VLQSVAVCCSVLQCVGLNTRDDDLQLRLSHDAVCVLLLVAVCCSVLQYAAVCCRVLQHVAACCSVLQCAALCCSALISMREKMTFRCIRVMVQ